jgi:hypothetical protein
MGNRSPRAGAGLPTPGFLQPVAPKLDSTNWKTAVSESLAIYQCDIVSLRQCLCRCREGPASYNPCLVCPVVSNRASGLLNRTVTNRASVPLRLNHNSPLIKTSDQVGTLIARSNDPNYFEDMSAWAGASTKFQHVHLEFPGMAGSVVQLRFEYTQDASGTCADVRPGDSCGVALDNVNMKSIKNVK